MGDLYKDVLDFQDDHTNLDHQPGPNVIAKQHIQIWEAYLYARLASFTAMLGWKSCDEDKL